MRRFQLAAKTRVVVVLSVAALMCGCASVGSIRSASPIEGTPLEFEASFAETCEAARFAVRIIGFDIADEYAPTESTWAVIGSSGVSLMSYGEFVRVTIEELSEDRCLARVYTKVKVATNVFAKSDYSADVFAAMLTSLEN